MPAERFTRKANTDRRKRQWEHVYESAKKRGADSGAAVRAANGVLAKSARKQRKKK